MMLLIQDIVRSRQYCFTKQNEFTILSKWLDPLLSNIKDSLTKSVVFVEESLMLERRGPSNLLNILNSVCFVKQYCLPLTISWMSNITFLVSPVLVNGKITAAL